MVQAYKYCCRDCGGWEYPLSRPLTATLAAPRLHHPPHNAAIPLRGLTREMRRAVLVAIDSSIALLSTPRMQVFGGLSLELFQKEGASVSPLARVKRPYSR